MKKIRKIILLIVCLLSIPKLTLAASGNIKITGNDKVVQGNKVTYTVTLSSGASIGSWQIDLNYDKSFLQLTSTTSEGGGTRMANSSSGTKKVTYTYTFKALKTGSTKVSIGGYLVYAFDDMSEMAMSTSNKSVTIITQAELEASYSKDNNLKSLSVEGYELNTPFSKDTLEYSISVPEGTEKVNVSAQASDSRSSVSGAGEVSLTEGLNTINIIVKAENGSEKTYTITINVIDTNPINIKIDNEDYTIVKLRKNYTCPLGYEEKDIIINEITIPACFNDKVNYTLVGIKDSSGNIINAIYDNNKYSLYNEINGTSLQVIVLNNENELDGYEKVKLELNGIKYDAFQNKDSKRFYIIYGMNIMNGEKDYYIYDSELKTISIYDSSYVNNLSNINKIYFIALGCFALGLLLALICIIKLNNKNKKLKRMISGEEKDNKKEKKKDKELLEEI